MHSEDAPFHWLDLYFRHRQELAARDAAFQCPPACRQPGCRSPFLQIPLSLPELWAAARFLELPLWEVFSRYVFPGPFVDGREDWLRRLVLRLHKPCPFLKEGRCAIYPVRPLACILFPEYQLLTGEAESWRNQEEFRDFPCLRDPPVLPPGRGRILRQLHHLYVRDLFLTDLYLWGHSPCYLDCTPVKAARGCPGTADPDQMKDLPEQSPSSAADLWLERILRQHPDMFPFQAEARRRISALASPSGLRELAQWFQDERRQPLLGRSGSRTVVYRFRRGRFIKTWRAVPPPGVAGF